MVKVILPPKGYIARDLVVSSLQMLGVSETWGDVVEIEDAEKLKEMIKKFREDKTVTPLVKRFKKNYGKVVSYILENDIDSIVNDFFKESSEDFYYTLLFPELMEAERWYGGWNGRKGDKTSIEISKQSALLATLALSLFKVFWYKEEKSDVIGVAPVDTAIQYQLCKNLISEERIRVKNLDKVSHLGRLFLFAMYYSDNVCQKLVVLKVSKRIDVLEDTSFTAIEPIIKVWRNINSKSPEDKEKYARLLNDNKLVNEYSSIDVFNRIANYVFEAVSGTLSPDQMGYFIARDTYLKDDAFGFITPKVIKRLEEAVELVTREGVYSV